jgi:hypothetical protein
MIEPDADDTSPMSDDERARRLARIKAELVRSLADPSPRIGLDEAFAQVKERLRRLQSSGNEAA